MFADMFKLDNYGCGERALVIFYFSHVHHIILSHFHL